MKRILVFISLLLPIVASAQFLTNGTMILPQSNEIVRTQKTHYFYNDMSISLSQNVSGIYSFYIMPIAQRIEINYPISVINNFEIIGDMLYFCGASNGHGILGQLSLSNIGTNTNIISLPFLKEVSKIKLRDISGVTHVFGIGMSYTLPLNLNNYIFDVFNNGTNFICSAYSYDPNQDVELFTDIDLTNQYIAVFGYHKSSTRLMVWKRNTNQTNNFIVTRSIMDSTLDNKFFIKHTINDNVAIAYVKKDNSNNPLLYINTMDLNNFALLSSRIIQSNYYPIKAIDFFEPLNRLLVLQSSNTINNISYSPLSVPVSSQLIHRAILTGVYLNDLSLYRDSSYTVVGTNINNKLLIFNKNNYNYSVNCNDFDEVKMEPITTTFNYYGYLMPVTSILSHQNYNVSLHEEQIQTICH